MSTSTTTIRVSVRTRDRLVAQARQRGSRLPDWSPNSRRAPSRKRFSGPSGMPLADAGIAGVREEDRDWDDTAGDGIA